MLVTTVICPFGMMCTEPSSPRSCTTRRFTLSTEPDLPATSTTSPTAMELSTSRKNPVMTSLTRLCAPNEKARPRMPAPAAKVLMPPRSNGFS